MCANVSSVVCCPVSLLKFDDEYCDVTSRGQNNKHLQSCISRVSLSYYILTKTDIYLFIYLLTNVRLELILGGRANVSYSMNRVLKSVQL